MPLITGDTAIFNFPNTPTVSASGFDYYLNSRTFNFGTAPVGKWKAILQYQLIFR